MKLSFQQLCAGLCITAILIACLSMHFVLRWGLPVDTDASRQIQFVASNQGIWKLGWLSWNLAAIALLCFCAMLYQHSNRALTPKLGLFCVAIAVFPDLRAEYLLGFGLSELALVASAEEFVALQHRGIQLTGVYANGLYNIGGLMLTLSLLTESKLARGVAGIGIISWLIGLSLSFSTLAGNFKASELATASSRSLNLIFMGLVSIRLFGKPINT